MDGIPPKGLSYGGSVNKSLSLRKDVLFSLTPSLNQSALTGGDTLSYSVAPLGLPQGIALNKDSGILSGTPTQLMWPATTYKVQVKNTGGTETSLVDIAVIDSPPEDLQYNDANIAYPVEKDGGYVYTQGTPVSPDKTMRTSQTGGQRETALTLTLCMRGPS